MYQALYRKYRPRHLTDVIGQDIAVRILANSLEKDRVSHAYLFSGPRGSGKTSAAKIIANIVNCSSPANNKACGSCVFCTQKEEQKMDIIEIDAASNNGVDEIREINIKVKLSPSLGKYKVYIIDEVHMLTTGAFNALLKTLEEPPAHIIFILATTDPQKIPSTILSRCQKIEFNRINIDSMKKGLQNIVDNEKINIKESVIEEICRLSDGGMRDAINTLDQLVLYSDEIIEMDDLYEMMGIVQKTEITELINNIKNSNLFLALNKIDEYNKQGKNIIRITEQIISELRNIIVETNANDSKYNIEFLKITNESLSEMRRFNNPKLLLDVAVIKMVSYLGNNFELKEQNNIIEKVKIQNVKETVNNNAVIMNEINIIQENKTLNNDAENDETMSNKGQQNISREILITDIPKEKTGYNEFINMRIENTLSNFLKSNLIEVKEKIGLVEDYVHDEVHKKYALILIDGVVKAASDEYIIFVYDSIAAVENFNKELIGIEKLINLIYNRSYKVISVEIEAWEIIKKAFNEKKQKYIYTKEAGSTEEIINKIFKIKKDKIENLFDGIIEYN